MPLTIAEVLAKATNDEILSTTSPQSWPLVKALIDKINREGIARYWTTIHCSELTAILNSEPPIARFVVGMSERFMMLMHQELIQQPYLAGQKTEAVTALAAGWWKSVVESIVELRAVFPTSVTLSEGLAAQLTFPSEDLTKMIQGNYWLVVLYLAAINGTFANINDNSEQKND